MDGGGGETAGPFIHELSQWRHVGDAYTSGGERIGKPWGLVRAELIDGLCQRYGCLPSALLKESAEVLRMVKLLESGKEGAKTPQDLTGPEAMEEALSNASKVLG